MKKINFFAAKFVIIFLLLVFTVMAIRLVTRTAIIKSKKEFLFGKIVFFDREDLSVPKVDVLEKKTFIPWVEQYPFVETLEQENEFENQVEEPISSIEEKISENKNWTIKFELKSISNITEKIQNWITSNFIIRNSFINFCSAINSFLRWKPSVLFEKEAKSIELENGYFAGFVPKHDVNEKVESLNSFNEFLKSKDIPLLYVQAPFKIDPNDKNISGVLDFSNQNTDEFLYSISSLGINYIDMRHEIEKTGKDFYSFFFKTDHHWKPETGFWVAKIIAENLNRKFGKEIDISIFDSENFNYKVYEKSFMGSAGRELIISPMLMDDITLIEPKKNYFLTTNIYSFRDVIQEKTGGFETLIFPDHLQNKYNAYTDEGYAIYVNGNHNMQITNHSANNEIRLLVLGESFANVVEAFLCLGVRQLDSLDLRVFSGSLETWINRHDRYDACIIIINGGYFSYDIDWSSHTDLWDFR